MRRLFLALGLAVVIAGAFTGNPPEDWIIDGGFGWGLGLPTR